MLLEVESALTNRLASELTRTGVKILPIPDNLLALKQPVMAGQVLVAYKQSTFRQVTSEPLLYEQLLQFDINTQVKGLRSHTGAYPLLDEIRFLLAGWYCGSSTQKRPAYFQSERFVDVDEGIWSYLQSLIVPLTIEAGVRPEFAPDDLIDWEDLEQIRVAIGLQRSPIDRIKEISVSTKDSDIKVEIPIENAE